MNKRNLLTLILFIIIILFPYYIYLPLLTLGIVFIPFYYEAVPLGFLVDALYGPFAHHGLSFSFPVGIFVTVLVLILLPIRERMRFYNV